LNQPARVLHAIPYLHVMLTYYRATFELELVRIGDNV